MTLLAHSMGGPMTLIMLQRQSQKWKDKYINALITLSAVWAGSVKAIKVFAIGEYFNLACRVKLLLIIISSSSPINKIELTIMMHK